MTNVGSDRRGDEAIRAKYANKSFEDVEIREAFDTSGEPLPYMRAVYVKGG